MADIEQGIEERNGHSPQNDSNEEDTLSPLKDYKRKTKRISPPPGEKSPQAAMTYGSNKAKLTDKHSRIGKGRGLPKKGGAGGKGTWGKPGVVYSQEELQCRDEKDIDYESDEEYVVHATSPELTEEEFESNIPPILKDYLHHGDADELAGALAGLNVSTQKHKVVSFAINMAMDRKATERELVSQLISELYGSFISQKAMQRGFRDILNSLDDMILDIPGAAEMAGQFIARAVADDCLPPAFVNSNASSESGRFALKKAEILLKVKHGISRLDNIWGVGGARQSVEHLREKIILLIKEYFSSSDLEEIITLTLEDGTDRTLNLTLKFLQSLAASNIVTPNEVRQGYQRVFDSISDLALDIPYAPTMLEKFCVFCVQDDIIPESFVSKIPTRGRKRYVSEGDGGQVKEGITYGVKA
ncbi:Programmed cell death protein 4 [Trichoplax sp. H2]|nr:Programmed cell death protein 4 [Trichoplax sp. H2]|eukprot:RDD42363.1 Programmed cell death protein 4 [Trichoplax sp. H2]